MCAPATSQVRILLACALLPFHHGTPPLSFLPSRHPSQCPLESKMGINLRIREEGGSGSNAFSDASRRTLDHELRTVVSKKEMRRDPPPSPPLLHAVSTVLLSIRFSHTLVSKKEVCTYARGNWQPIRLDEHLRCKIRNTNCCRRWWCWWWCRRWWC